MVSEYLECGDNTEYDVVQLLAALDLTGTRQYVDHGSMIAIVRHKSPYLINNTSPLILSIVLGTKVLLCSVIGIPYILAMGVVVDLMRDQLVYSEMNNEFPMQFDST